MPLLNTIRRVLFVFLINKAESLAPEYQISALIDIYYWLHGDTWDYCECNISQIEKGYLPDYCPLFIQIKNISENINNTLTTYQVITSLDTSWLWFTDINITAQLPKSIYNLSTLTSLTLTGTNINGTLDESIGNLKNLTKLNINYISLTGTIPSTICELHHLQDFVIQDVPIIGTMPLCMFEHTKNLKYLTWTSTSIEGSIPTSLCNCNKLKRLNIAYNNYVFGPMPLCQNDSFKQLDVITIQNNPHLSGSISSAYLCAEDLRAVYIRNNTDMTENRIPICWDINKENHISKLSQINLDSNNFVGSFPSLNGTELEVLSIANNKLIGTVSDLIYNSKSLLALIIHNNDFIENDISLPLEYLLRASNLTLYPLVISLYGNKRISGTLPDFDKLFIDTHTTSLLLHGCDIHGTIPRNLRFEKQLENLTLFDNRFSCKLPDLFASKTENNHTRMIIPGNLLECDDKNEFPNWLGSLFQSARNLFVTPVSKTSGWGLLLISFICLAVHIIIELIRQKNKYQRRCYLENNKKLEFVRIVELFQFKFSDWKLLLLVVLALILYPLSSTYYKCTPSITWFSLSWFYHKNINSFYYWSLFIISILMNLMFCHILSTLYMIQFNRFKMNALKPNENIQSLLSEYDDVDSNFTEELNGRIDIEYNVMMKQSKCIAAIKFAIFTMLYLFGIITIILYLFCESLPNDNTLIASLYTRTFITRSMSIVLAINNSLIVPNLVESWKIFISHEFLQKYKTEIVLFLRTINTLIIPIITSVLVLNDCGRWWIKYWRPCNHENRDTFNVEIELWISSGPIQLLSADDVCSINDLSSINWNKCIRSFYYNWTYVLISKYIVMIVIPFIVIIYKCIQYKLITLYHKYKMEKQQQNIEIKIDSEYSMIITSFESVIAFSIISPLIIPIVLVAIDSNIFCYNIMINKLKWKLTTYKNIQSFPVHLLLIGILCGQFLTCLFFIASLQNMIIFTLYIITLCFMDIIYLFISCKSKFNTQQKLFNMVML